MGHFLSCIRMLDIPAHSLTLISGVEIPGRFISTTFIIYGHYQGWQVYSIYIVITASSNLLHSYSDVLFLVCCLRNPITLLSLDIHFMLRITAGLCISNFLLIFMDKPEYFIGSLPHPELALIYTYVYVLAFYPGISR